MALKEPGIAMAESIQEAVQDTVRLYPKSDPYDVVAGMLWALKQYAAGCGMTVTGVTTMWQQLNLGRMN